jgi:prevent-host-death family protein
MKPRQDKKPNVPVVTVSSREFNQDVTRAKKATEKGPVLITDRGRPAHVLLSIQDFRRLTGQRRSLLQALSMPGISRIDLEIPGRSDRPKAASFS